MSEKYTHHVIGAASALIRNPDGSVRDATPEELAELRKRTEPALMGVFKFTWDLAEHDRRPLSHDFVVRLWMIAAGLVVVGAFIAAVLLSGCTPKSQGYVTPDERGAVTAGKVVYLKGPQPEWCADVHADGTCDKAFQPAASCIADSAPLRFVPCKGTVIFPVANGGPGPARHSGETCREMVDRVSRESHITLSVVCLPEKR